MTVTSYFHKWHFKYTALLIATILALIYVLDFPAVQAVINTVSSFGYWGALLAGCLFVSSFTVAPAGVLLYRLADTLPPAQVAIFAGIGAVVGDYLIFRFLRDHIFEELRPLFLKCGGGRLMACLERPYLSWLLPVIGAIIIASPFPDEIGIGMLGASSLKSWQFMILSFVLNAAGIFALISVTHAL